MKTLFSFILLIFCLIGNSQSFIPGQVYYGTDSFTEYRVGNLPIILSSPHGGYLTPSSLPDRACVGCATGRDSYTQELTREIENALFFHTGCYPHVIINKLHRIKLDANREIIEATDSNLVTEPYWHDYMNFVDSAKNLIYKEYPKGIFLDIHGHAHTIQRIELGYALSGTDLRMNDSSLNLMSINTKTSILNLKYSNLNSYTHSQLIRGANSFGAMIQKRGFPAVPSDSIQNPLLGEPYFGGGYNTVKFGSRNGGTIDGIQIESHQGVRFGATIRAQYANQLALAILEYLEEHYFVNFSNGYCNYLSSLNESQQSKIKVYPNPSSNILNISGITQKTNYSLYSINGLSILSGTIEQNEKIDVSSLPSGLYFIKLSNDSGTVTIKIIKD